MKFLTEKGAQADARDVLGQSPLQFPAEIEKNSGFLLASIVSKSTFFFNHNQFTRVFDHLLHCSFLKFLPIISFDHLDYKESVQILRDSGADLLKPANHGENIPNKENIASEISRLESLRSNIDIYHFSLKKK